VYFLTRSQTRPLASGGRSFLGGIGVFRGEGEEGREGKRGRVPEASLWPFSSGSSAMSVRPISSNIGGNERPKGKEKKKDGEGFSTCSCRPSCRIPCFAPLEKNPIPSRLAPRRGPRRKKERSESLSSLRRILTAHDRSRKENVRWKKKGRGENRTSDHALCHGVP